MPIWALLMKGSLANELVGDAAGCGLRMIEIGSVQGGGVLVQLFLTKGNCMLVAPVREFTTYPFRVPEDRLGKFGLAKPATLGYPPLQLASPGTVPELGRATQFVPVGGNVLRGQPPPVLGTKTVPP